MESKNSIEVTSYKNAGKKWDEPQIAYLTNSVIDGNADSFPECPSMEELQNKLQRDKCAIECKTAEIYKSNWSNREIKNRVPFGSKFLTRQALGGNITPSNVRKAWGLYESKKNDNNIDNIHTIASQAHHNSTTDIIKSAEEKRLENGIKSDLNTVRQDDDDYSEEVSDRDDEDSEDEYNKYWHLPKGAPLCLAGKSFVVEGARLPMRAAAAEDFIKQWGGQVQTDVNINTDYLVAGDKLDDGKPVTAGNNYRRATDIGRIHIIGQAELLEMVAFTYDPSAIAEKGEESDSETEGNNNEEEQTICPQILKNKMCDILNKKNEDCEKVLLNLNKDLGLLKDKRSNLMLGTLKYAGKNYNPNRLKLEMEKISKLEKEIDLINERASPLVEKLRLCRSIIDGLNELIN